jgi:hypothetical protein
MEGKLVKHGDTEPPYPPVVLQFRVRFTALISCYTGSWTVSESRNVGATSCCLLVVVERFLAALDRDCGTEPLPPPFPFTAPISHGPVASSGASSQRPATAE